jgi:hypothetical protein
MKKIIIIPFILISIVSKAQFYTSFNIGYSIPTNTEKYNIFSERTELNSTITNSVTTIDDISGKKYYKNEIKTFELIKGVFFSAGTGYLFKNKYRLSLNLNYFDNQSFNNFASDNNITYTTIFVNSSATSNYTCTSTYTSRNLSFSPNIGYNINYKKFSSEFFVGFNIDYFWSFIEINNNLKVFQLNTGEEPNSKSIYKMKSNYIDQANLNGGIVFMYKLSNHLQLALTGKFYYRINSTYNEDKYILYYSYRETNTTPIIDETEREINYYGAFYYKNIDLSIGVRYNFGGNK